MSEEAWVVVAFVVGIAGTIALGVWCIAYDRRRRLARERRRMRDGEPERQDNVVVKLRSPK